MNHQPILSSTENIERIIFIVRGQKVLVGLHLAKLYGIETRVLMQAVKRNRDRFSADFIFSLTREEILRISHSVTSLKYSKSVYVFTEQGVAMLSSILNSPRAIQMNIAIMRAFVRLREFLSTPKELALKLRGLEMKIGRHDEDIRMIFGAIQQLMQPSEQKHRKIGFHKE